MSFVENHPANTVDLSPLYRFADANAEMFLYIRVRGNDGATMREVEPELLKSITVMKSQWAAYGKLVDEHYPDSSGLGWFIKLMRVCDYIQDRKEK